MINKIVIYIFLLFVLTGCGKKKDELKSYLKVSFQIDYEIKQNDNTITYEINERSYKYRMIVSGRDNNATCFSYYIILSDSTDIKFGEVSKSYYSSVYPLPDHFFIVESGYIE